MDTKISLKEAERKVFQTVHQDGLWDIFIGSIFLMFAVAPFLSASLGDFWSAFIFLPFQMFILLIVYVLRRKVVGPRIGSVQFNKRRRIKMMKVIWILVVINVIAFFLGLVAAFSSNLLPGSIYSILMGSIILMIFTVLGYALDYPRLYIYGLLVGLSPPVGEWLYKNYQVSHHGFPVTFGITSGIMILSGIILFVVFLRKNPPSTLSDSPLKA